MNKITYLKAFFLAMALIVGTFSSWAQTGTTETVLDVTTKDLPVEGWEGDFYRPSGDPAPDYLHGMTDDYVTTTITHRNVVGVTINASAANNMPPLVLYYSTDKTNWIKLDEIKPVDDTFADYSFKNLEVLDFQDVYLKFVTTSHYLRFKTITITTRTPSTELYTITFDPQAGIVDNPTQQEDAPEGGVVLASVATPTATNWSFVGWSESPVGQTSVRPELLSVGTLYHPRTHTTLYAVYSYKYGDGTEGNFTISRANTDASANLQQTWNWESTSTTGETVSGKANLKLPTTSSNYMQFGRDYVPHPYNEIAVPGAITGISITQTSTGYFSWTPYLSGAGPIKEKPEVGNSLSTKTHSSTNRTITWEIDENDNYKYFYLSTWGASATALTRIVTIEINYKKTFWSYNSNPTTEQPVMTVTEETVDPMTAALGSTGSSEIHINGANLLTDVTVEVEGENASMFTVNPEVVALAADQSLTNAPVAITYKPTAFGTHTAKLKISSQGVTVIERDLSGSSSVLATPLALAASATTNTTFVANWEAHEFATKYELNVVSEEEIFKATFDDVDGTGGNDGQWSGNIANSSIGTYGSWTFSNGYKGDKCLKLGTGSKQGVATTPSLGLVGDGTLTFRAGAWNGTSEKTSLLLEITGGGTLESNSITITKGEFNSYQLNITGATADTKISFKGESDSNSRFFLDEVAVSKGTSTLYEATTNSYTVTELSAETDYYYTVKAFAGEEENEIISESSNEIKVTTLATPILTVDTDEIPEFNLVFGESAPTATIHVEGSKFFSDVTIQATGAGFTVSPKSITPVEGNVASTEVTVTYNPSTAGQHTGTLTISASGVESKVITLKGTTSLAAPNAVDAQDITYNSFTAKWDAAAGATDYELTVYTYVDEVKTPLEDYNQLAVTTTDHSVTGLEAVMDYYYTVVATVTVNEEKISSAASQEIKVTTLSAPAIIADKSEVEIKVLKDQQGMEIINIEGVNLTSDLQLIMDGDDLGYFSVSPESITQTEGTIPSTPATITYAPTAYGAHTATLILYSPGAPRVNIPLSGTSTLEAPVALTPDDVTYNSFTAKWNAVTGADKYKLTVYTKVADVREIVEGYDKLVVNGTEQAVTGLNTLTNYFFNVVAIVSVDGTDIPSAESNEAETTTLDGPSITVAEETIPAMEASKGGEDTKTINVSGANLAAEITLTLQDNESGYFTVSPLTIPQAGGTVASTPVTVSYKPLNYGAHTAKLTVSSAGATSKVFELEGKSILPAPTATVDAITYNSFTAKWNTVTDATKYQLTVYTKEGDVKTPVEGYDKSIVTTTEKEVTGLTAQTDYFFTVVAIVTVDAIDIYSEESNEVDATTLAQPLITVVESSIPKMEIVFGQTPVTEKINVSGTNLTANITLAVEDDVNGNFKVEPASIAQASGTAASTEVTVTYDPKSLGEHTAKLIITSAGADTKEFNLTGEATFTATAPVATDATDPTQTTFTANWNAVTDAAKYELTVYTKSGDVKTPVTGYDSKEVTGTSDEVTGLTPATEYFYTVKAVFTVKNIDIKSADSNEKNISTEAVPTPVIVVNPTEVPAMTTQVGTDVTQTVTVSGVNLTADITLAVNEGMFEVTPETITHEDGTAPETTVTIKYNPTEAGTHTATLTISSTGAEPKIIPLNGTATAATVPTIVITETEVPTMTAKVDEETTETIHVSGVNLTADILLAITSENDTDKDMFDVTPKTIVQEDGTVAVTEVTITYKPTATGSHTATLTITSTGAQTKTLQLNGTATAKTGLPEYASNLNLYTNNGYVYFTTIGGLNVEIYNSAGQPVYRGTSVEGLNQIRVVEGVLVVKIGETVNKVLVK